MTGMLDILREILPRLDSRHSPRILWSLFEKRDRVSQSKYGFQAAYKSKLSSKCLKMDCGKWALETIDVLNSLGNEIQMLFLVRTGSWNSLILAEAMTLLQFLMDFLGDLKDLKDACRKKGNMTCKCFAKVRIYKEIADDLESAQDSVTSTIDLWLGKIGKRKPKLSEDTTISAASFRELIIRNRLCSLQLQGHKTQSGQAILESMTKEMRLLASELEESLPNGNYVTLGRAWIPRTIVVIYDVETSLLLTGASQPACDAFIFWKSVTRTITRLRLGKRFARIVDQCSEKFYHQANRVKKEKMTEISKLCSHFNACNEPEEPRTGALKTLEDGHNKSSKEKHPTIITQVSKIYDEIVLPKTSDMEKVAQDIMQSSEIVCLAVEAESLQPRPPCLRCQSMYSGWNHWRDHRAPKNQEEAKETIAFISDQMDNAPAIKSDKISYCAESIAAAKLYTLRTGKLVLR